MWIQLSVRSRSRVEVDDEGTEGAVTILSRETREEAISGKSLEGVNCEPL
jgi:hypothetical protein